MSEDSRMQNELKIISSQITEVLRDNDYSASSRVAFILSLAHGSQTIALDLLDETDPDINKVRQLYDIANQGLHAVLEKE